MAGAELFVVISLLLVAVLALGWLAVWAAGSETREDPLSERREGRNWRARRGRRR